MKGNKPMKKITNITYPALALFALAGFALSPKAQAACEENCDAALETTALGTSALMNNTTGQYNTAIGSKALLSNTDGQVNTAIGSHALFFNTTGSSNTATGESVLYLNTTGYGNTGNGQGVLYFNTTGYLNTATGAAALNMNSTGYDNTATGYYALLNNTDGHDNTAIGYHALVGSTHGSSNIALGSNAGSVIATGNNNIDIGNAGAPGDSKRIRIGTTGTHTKTFIAGISGTTVPDGVGVIVGANGQLGTIVSSARFKDEIKPMDKASEALLRLQPVTFHYKKQYDPEAIPQFGLVAEDVGKIDPDLVARDEDGKPYTVRYEAVNAMLLNEFLKEHKKVETLEAKMAKLETTLEKVSARLETEQAVPRLVESR
jgi:hypothetical protein